MKYRSIYFKTEQFSFPLLSVKKMFPSHSDLLMAFTYFPNCLPTAFGLVWVTPYSCLLRPSLNAEGQTRVTTRHTTTAQCHPRRRAIHAIYFTPHARACRHYHDYLKESQRGEVTCPEDRAVFNRGSASASCSTPPPSLQAASNTLGGLLQILSGCHNRHSGLGRP